MSKPAVLSTAERERLHRLLETSPLSEIASELIAYRNQLIAGGFRKHEATEFTMQLHEYLLSAVFVPNWHSD